MVGLGVGKLIHGAARPIGPQQGGSEPGFFWVCLRAAVGGAMMFWAHQRGG